MKLTLDSIQWLNEVSPYKAAENNEKSDEVENEADTLSSLLEWSLKPDTVGSCTSCKVSLDFEDRSSVIEHYQSNWHKFNVKRVSRGNAPVNEEEFEDGMQDDGPESAEKEEDDEEIEFWTPSGRSYFNQNDNIYSVPRCILRDGENDVTTNILNRPLDCAIFLLSAGHFAAGIFHGGRLVAHRAFHRYVARAKQGGVQSQYDNAHGNANSAGAALRRYNEAKLREDIVQIVTGWKNVLEKTPLVFIRCATYQKAIFHTNSDVLPKGDKRIRTIPFETRRPTLDEVQSTWEKLKAVESHGTIAEFRKDMRNLFEKHRKTLNRKKKTPEEWRGEDIEEKEGRNNETRQEPRKVDHIKVRPEPEVREDPWPKVSDEWRKKLYNAVRTDDILAVQSLLEDSEIDKEQALDFIPKTRFPPDDLSYLHVASSRDSPLVLKYFLEACDCDPCVKEKDGKPPYSMASNKEIKDIFIQFRVANPNKYNWLRSHIPEPQILSAEEEAKLAEKKKAKKAKQKEKQRAEKELAKKEEEERQEKARWLAMSERDRRGILVERRLAGLPLLTRCDQCATVIPDKPFQYETFKFCSPPCVNQHRAAVK